MPSQTTSQKTTTIKRLDPYADLPKPVRKRVVRLVKLAKLQGQIPNSAQRTIPYTQMYRSGLCHATGVPVKAVRRDKLWQRMIKKLPVPGLQEKKPVTLGYYTKTVEFFDTNYRLAKRENKEAIFENWCRFLNYFDASVSVQLTFLNQKVDVEDFYRSIEIPAHGDDFNALRAEYVTMLKAQFSKGNNGLIKRKFLTFGIHAEDQDTAQIKLDRIESEIIGTFRTMKVVAFPLNGYERLEIMHDVLNIGTDRKLNFNWDLITQTGLSTKDFISANSMNFSQKRQFELQERVGRASFLQINAPELSDDILAQLLELDSPLIVTMHLHSLEQADAIKQIKDTMTDLNKMKIEEQMKATRMGYGMEILPPDLVTFIDEADDLRHDLESRNERRCLLTFTVTNFGVDETELENIFSTAKQIAQQHSCELLPLDWQQEAGLVSALPIGINKVGIERMLTTSSTAIFIPFQTQELFQKGGLYYGVNATSKNMIMIDRLTANNPNGLILGVPGCFTGDTKVVLADGSIASFEELMSYKDGFKVKSYDVKTGKELIGTARNVRITHYAKKLVKVQFDDGYTVSCTPDHRFLLPDGSFMDAHLLRCGQRLHSGHRVALLEHITLDTAIPVYDMEVDDYDVFMLENGVIVHNSGKSFAAKREMVNVALARPEDSILILDPEREYTALVQALGGQVIDISANSPHHINPMDLNIDAKSAEDSKFDPVKDKIQFLFSFCEQVMSRGDIGLDPVEKSVINRCAVMVYENYLKNPVKENMPILQHLYDKLLEQKEQQAQHIAAALELYVTGSFNVFNHLTNVETDNRIICFDTKDLGQHLQALGMLTVQDQIWSRVRINRAKKLITRYYVDEFHLLLADKQTAGASVEIWKRFRKWGGVPTGITQNVSDFLASPQINNIFSNSDFVYLLNQASKDQKILASELNISEHQLGYVTNTNPGEGLLIFGGTIIPFEDKFPKDSQLYKLMSTKLEESVTA